MTLCYWGVTTRDSRSEEDEAQPMGSRGGLKALLHWAGPGSGDPEVIFSEATLTAQEVCIHFTHKVCITPGYLSLCCVTCPHMWSQET